MTQSSLVPSEEVEFVVKISHTKNKQLAGLHGFSTGEFYATFKEAGCVLYELFQKREEEEVPLTGA